MKTLTNAMTEIATWSNNKVSIVTHAALEANCPELLHSHQERTARKADNPDLMSVYEHTGLLLCTAATEPIWERNIKCTMEDGFTFYVNDTMQHVGGEHFWLSTIFERWIAEKGAAYEVISNEPTWEAVSYERIKGLQPGSMLITEKGINDRVLMASELKVTIADVFSKLEWLGNGNWKLEPWTALRGFAIDANHEWCWFNAHRGQRVKLAQHDRTTIWVYVTA